jgi:hypothetical protein
VEVGLPLLRIGGERVFRATEHLDYTVPDGFAGLKADERPLFPATVLFALGGYCELGIL